MDLGLALAAMPAVKVGPRVLVTDDDAAIRAPLTAVCKRMGFHCDEAADGDEALRKIQQNIFDVVLLDLMMPKVNGYQVIAALRG